MRKLCLGLSVAAMVMLAACGGDSGSSAEVLGESSSSGEVDVIGSCASDESLSSSSEVADSSTSEAFSSSEQDDLSSSSLEEPESSSEEKSSSSLSLSSGDASVYNAFANTLTDLRDGQVYRTTTIEINDAEQGIDYSEVWMAENLNFVTENSWCGGGSGTTEGDCSIYGRLYTWAAAVAKPEDECGYSYTCGLSGTVRGVCPKGWHLPSYDEWNELITAVGGSSVAGKMLKSETGWEWDSGVENDDTFGFSALPAGYRTSDESYYAEGTAVTFWNSTEYDSDKVYFIDLYYDHDYVYLDSDYKYYGFSVRCLMD